MVQYLRLIVLTTILSLIFSPLAAQDYDKGYQYYEAGNYEAAFKEWKPLADQGGVNAQAALGDLYTNGWGIPQDYSEAFKWYRSAAEQGHEQAIINVAVLYYTGRGVKEDPIHAYMWAKIGVALGSDTAKKLSSMISENLDPEQTQKGLQLVTNFLAGKCQESEASLC